MSALLDIVREARDLRDTANVELRRAIVRARSQHTLTEIGRAAGLGKQRISQIVNEHKREESHDPQ